jgi:hypothetical protein
VQADGTKRGPVARQLEALGEEGRRPPRNGRDDGETTSELVQGGDRTGQGAGGVRIDDDRRDRPVEVAAQPRALGRLRQEVECW